MRAAILSTVLLSGFAAGSAVSRRHPNAPVEPCCFQLRSAGNVEDTVSETNVGILRLLSSEPEAALCLDVEYRALTDERGAICSMSEADQQFECVDHSYAATRFDMARRPDKSTILLYDGYDEYHACPADDIGPEAGYNIHGTVETDSDCIPIRLVVKNASPGCPPVDSLEEAPPSPYDTDMKQAAAPPREVGEATKVIQDPPFRCKIDPNGPSLAPVSVTVSNVEGRNIKMPIKGEALISPNHLTRLTFNTPANWVPKDTELCAIQFRFPFCSDLPKNYPCFKWTGMEHDSLAEAGMHWTFEASSVKDWTPRPWWLPFDTPFQLITPEVNKVVGVLGCRNQVGPRSDTYLIRSVNEFALQYVQAGPESGFEDGVGAFMVPCLQE